MKSLHTFIISWPGQEAKAKFIYESILDFSDYVTLIHAGDTLPDILTMKDVIFESGAAYYGQKFKRCLELNLGDTLFIISADASCEDWPFCLSQCRLFFDTYNNPGIWAPDINFTPWTDDRVILFRDPQTTYAIVAQTDAIVWGISRPVISRLKSLNYDENNFGWGIDWAAIAYAFTNNLLVVRDYGVKVLHPKGSGYSRDDANISMNKFLSQLTLIEKSQITLLSNFTLRSSA
jgi:hypothetical protein